MDLIKILQFTTTYTEKPIPDFLLKSSITFYQQVFEIKVIFFIYIPDGRRGKTMTFRFEKFEGEQP